MYVYIKHKSNNKNQSSQVVVVRACVRAYVRTCVRACVRACVRVCVCVCVCCFYLILDFWFIYIFYLFFNKTPLV